MIDTEEASDAVRTGGGRECLTEERTPSYSLNRIQSYAQNVDKVMTTQLAYFDVVMRRRTLELSALPVRVFYKSNARSQQQKTLPRTDPNNLRFFTSNGYCATVAQGNH